MIPHLGRLVLAALVATAPAIAKDRFRDQPGGASTGCEWAGPGFVKVEGSSTCVRVGGSVRAEYGGTVGGGRSTWWPSPRRPAQ